jgi:TatD DNase family protein
MMEDLAADPAVVAIGEAGLDYYYDNSPRDAQQAAFRTQAELAVRLGLPLIVHTRDAEADTIAILNQIRPRRGVIHCFTGTPELAECALELGFMISFSGIVTFKSAGDIREVARTVPSDRLLVETDAPYLAPVPHRGRRNEPGFVVETATVLAELRNEAPEDLHSRTTENFMALFGIRL